MQNLQTEVSKQSLEFSCSARLNCCAEDVRVHSVVIPELELIDVKMQIFLADLVEGSDDPALHDGPEAFDGVGMNGPTDIFAASVMDHAMRNSLVQKSIALMIVRRKQADLMGDGFMNKAVQRRGIRAFNHAGDDIAFPLYRTDHNELPCSASTPKISASTFASVFVLRLPTHIGFVHFDIADQLLKFDIAERHANLAAHEPGSFVGAKAHVATNLQGADPLLTGEHQMNDAEPFPQGLIGILEDGADQYRKAIGIIRALLTLPVPFHVMQFMDLLASTTRTGHAFWPAVPFEIFTACILMRELLLKLYNRHLMDLQRVLLLFPHGLISRGVGRVCHV